MLGIKESGLLLLETRGPCEHLLILCESQAPQAAEGDLELMMLLPPAFVF